MAHLDHTKGAKHHLYLATPWTPDSTWWQNCPKALQTQPFLQFSLLLAKLVLATMRVFSIIAHWNEFVLPLIYLHSTEKAPMWVLGPLTSLLYNV